MTRKKYDPVEAGKRLRKLRGIRTKVGVSHELNLPYSTYCAYESGTRRAPLEVRLRIADYFNVSEESIFCTLD